MHTPSRLILTAAVAGAAVLVPLTAAAPAFADGTPTASITTVTPSATTVEIGAKPTIDFEVQEAQGGDPAGLSGHLIVQEFQNGKLLTEITDGVRGTAPTEDIRTLDTSNPGPIVVSVVFAPETANQTGSRAQTTVNVLANATVSVLSDTVRAGDSITAQVGELRGSDGANGTIAASGSAGLSVSGCTPTPDNPEQSNCTIPVPATTASGTYSLTLTYSGSPRYAESSAIIPVHVVGAPATATSTGAGTTTGATTTTTSTGHTASGGSGGSSASGAQTVTGVTGSAAGTTVTGTTLTGPATVQAPTDTSSPQPTGVVAPAPGEVATGVVAARTTAAGFALLPIAIAAGAGLFGLMVVALVVVLVIRSRRHAA